MDYIDTKLDYSDAESFASSQQALTDLVSSLNMHHPAFVQQMHTFSNMNPQYSQYLLGWLESMNVISRERSDSYIKYSIYNIVLIS